MATPPPDARATTIGKYIARFRQEKPRPREERKAASAQDEFWWTQPRNNGLCSSSTGDEMNEQRRGVELDEREMEMEHAQPKTQATATALEWEVDLLSDLSASQASSASAPAWSSLASSEPSPVVLQSTTTSSGRSVGIGAGFVQTYRRSVEMEDAVVDDGFVVVADAVEEEEEEEMKTLETSLEDPEIVIQRIRRRLGFQPQQQVQQQQHQQQAFGLDLGAASLSLSSVYSPLRDEQLEMAELLASFDSAPPTTPMESHQDERFALVLEDHNSVEQASPGKAEEMLQEQHEVNASAQQEADNEDTNETKSEEENRDLHDEVAMRLNENTAYECGDEHVETVDKQEASESDVCDEELSEAETEAETKVASVPEGETLALPADTMDEALVSSPPDVADHRDSATTTTSSGRKLPPATDEKPSPRLPPLSPARGPMFRMALTPSASPSLSPRLVGASAPPELTVETSKTLDSLLSLVVHSWGEESFFGGSDCSADAVETPVTAESVNISDNTPAEEKESKETRRAGPEPGKEADVKEDKAEDIRDHADSHASDPIVQMLCERIAVFEEALVRLDNKTNEEEAKDVQ